MSFTPIDRCRSCGAQPLHSVIDLGLQPLANSLVGPDDHVDHARYPLALVACPECSLVQLTGTVDPGEMFDTYNYFSSYSDTMVRAMEELAERTVRDSALGSDSLVLEIASNDGYLLTHYLRRGVRVLGVEPASNVARVAIERGIPTLESYFGLGLARRLRDDGHHPDVIHANNVLAHVPDVHDVMAGIALLIDDRGEVIVETPHLVRMIDDCLFDTIYHEHVFYYSLTAISRLSERHGLHVVDVERIPVHGGSLRVHLSKEELPPSPAVIEVLTEEEARDVKGRSYYAHFGERVEQARRSLLSYLTTRRAEGARVAGYGAAAKATVLLNHFHIDRDLVEYVVDRSPHKQGKLIPGVAIPVCSPERLDREHPDDLLILAWNLADEVIAQQEAHRLRGGRFLVPLPELRLL